MSTNKQTWCGYGWQLGKTVQNGSISSTSNCSSQLG